MTSDMPQDRCLEALNTLKDHDRKHLLEHALSLPDQILSAIESAKNYSEGDLPLDRSFAHLVGLGGSAIAGELLLDMVSPRITLNVHRGTKPPRDRSGVILSSYSGNTEEILELSRIATGGLHTAVILTSGGMLEQIGTENGLPVWKIPAGMLPRAAVGWSLGFLGSLLERWRILTSFVEHLSTASQQLKFSLSDIEPCEHPLIQNALPIAEAIMGRNVVVLYSQKCTGTAARFVAQLNENAKQPAFAVAMPEAMHNTVEGLGGASPEDWTLICMSDESEPPSLMVSINQTMKFFSKRGFTCLSVPSEGDNPFTKTLSRVFVSDMASLFLAGMKELDPGPIDVITNLKQSSPQEDI